MEAGVTAGAQRPSLHDIAAMPLSQSQEAMRTWYDPDWGKRTPEGQEQKLQWKVELSYTLMGNASFEVEAWDKADAESEAIKQLEQELDSRDFDVDVDICTEIAA